MPLCAIKCMHESQFKTRKCLDCSLTLQILKLKTKNQCDRQQLVDTGTMRERESKRFWVVNLGREAKVAFYFERWGKGGKFVIFGEVGLVGWARDLTIWSCGRSGPLRGDFNGWWGKSNWMHEGKVIECGNCKNGVGDAGYRSPYLSHAKRALYHLSYIPWLTFMIWTFNYLIVAFTTLV